MIPLLLSIPFLLIPRLYFGQEIEDFMWIDGQKEPNFWKFFAYWLPRSPAKLSWLWFLPVLFIIGLIGFPLIKWAQRRKSAKLEVQAKDWLLVVLQLLIVGVVTYLFSFAVDSETYNEEVLPSMIVMTASLLVYFVVLGYHNKIKSSQAIAV